MTSDAVPTQPRVVTPDNPYGISRSDLTSFIRKYYQDGRPDGNPFQRPLSLGDIDSSQGDRELFAPLFVDYAVNKAKENAEIAEAARIIGQGEIAKSALKRRLEGRRDKEGRIAYGLELPKLLGEAAVVRGENPLVDAALITREVLGDDTAATAATDAAAALGYIARLGLTIQPLPDVVIPPPATPPEERQDFVEDQEISL